MTTNLCVDLFYYTVESYETSEGEWEEENIWGSEQVAREYIAKQMKSAKMIELRTAINFSREFIK